MKIKDIESTPKIKKKIHHHNDLLQLTVRCINDFNDTTPEQVVKRILKEEWLHPESSDAQDHKKLLRDIRVLWPKAVADQEYGDAPKRKKLTYPEQLAAAGEYIENKVRYDTLKNRYIDADTGNETTPIDTCCGYNLLRDNESSINVVIFDRLFESLKVPTINPLKVWAEELPPWDKRDHIKKLCEYIPAEDPELLELYLKNWMIRAFIQAVNPHDRPTVEVVNRHFLILQSELEEGGKSSFLGWLSPFPEWFTSSGIEEGKDGKRALAEYMIIVDDEMAGITHFKQIESFKRLISLPKINVRLPYAKKDSELSRVASFCGSSNKMNIFSIGEQNTRFLCVPLKPEYFNYKEYTKRIDKTKLWAQVKALAATNWLIDNSLTIKAKRKVTNERFEKETMEMDLINSYTRLITLEDVVPDRYNIPQSHSNIILRTGDVATLIGNMEKFKGLRININILGSALQKKYGKPKKGYTVGNLFEGGTIKGERYIKTKLRSIGYPIFFSEQPIGESTSELSDKVVSQGSRTRSKTKKRR